MRLDALAQVKRIRSDETLLDALFERYQTASDRR
jgi:hypothetical protein